MNTALYEACVLFRSAIERTPKNLLSIRFSKFPRGSCGDAAPILGLYLDRKGLGAYDYVCGEWYGSASSYFFYSHAWLEKDNIIVDITGDQFKCRPPVYIGEKDLFYSKFKTEPRNRHAYYEPLISDNSPLLNDYETILDYIM